MNIRNFLHKGLRRLYAEDRAKGVPAASADNLRKQQAYHDAMRDAEELKALRLWSAHQLSGDRGGTWSLSVTQNGRLKLRIDLEEPAVFDMNLEDYH